MTDDGRENRAPRPWAGRRLWFAAGAVAIAAAAAMMWHWTRPAPPTPAPAAVVTTIAGKPLALASLKGKVVLVNFWATTCAPCLREMPALTALYRRYRSRGYEMVAIAMAYDPPNVVLDYARREQLPFIVALDLDGSAAQAFGNVEAIPASFLIDRSGMIVGRYRGQLDPAELSGLVDRELGD